MTIQLPDEPSLHDKILACWIGKNCGGTLGGPLEKPFSQAEPFDVSYYPVIQEGGIPNDDLEIQLAWLKALEEVGLDLTSDDLASYWLDHVGYNPDEYGFMKTNLRLGLKPPVSGFYNNYFKHSMGCPIRTEIWACIAAGHPRLAARYALIDSICDHGGGESINGSLFNVTVEAAAFVVSDRNTLVDIGLSYLPPTSETARCIRAALTAWQEGQSWQEARQAVIDVGGNINAMHSPPNIAFQVIGWLYGEGFGDALCKAVNCGYDTDCTGATLGSILGILGGSEAIPERWKKPLGDAISTSAATGGVRHFHDGPHPVPSTITELTERVIVLQKKVSARYGQPSRDISMLYADAGTRQLAEASPTQISFSLRPHSQLSLDYLDTPQIRASGDKKILIELAHSGPDPLAATLSILTSDGWSATPSEIQATATRESSWTQTITLHAPERRLLQNSQEILVRVNPDRRPGCGAKPLTMIGAPAYLRSEVFPLPQNGVPIEVPFVPETLTGHHHSEQGRGAGWTETTANGYDIGACLPDFKQGVVYLRGFLKNPRERQVWMHTCSTIPAKVWLNGKLMLSSAEGRRFRPWSKGYQTSGLEGEVSLPEGWIEVLIKFAADASTPPFQCHLLYSDPTDLFAGVTDLLWTRFPWDEGNPG